MGGIAFVFSGQGDQYPGMGKNLYDAYPEASRVFDMCERLRPGTLEQCFNGTDEDLKITANTQPCLFAMELAAYEVLVSRGIKATAFAGFSLGEVSAAAAAGVFDIETAFRLVCRRGEIMQREAEKYETSMAAVVKLTPEAVAEICEKYDGVYPVNFNCPGQVTVSGLTSQMASFSADVKAAGGRAIPLKVGGAFHSPFMKAASEDFFGEVSRVHSKLPDFPLYSNATAEPYGKTGETVAELISRQICSPVLWERTVRNIISASHDTFIEIGPGKTLTNMIKKTDAEVKTYSVSEIDSLLSEVGEC